MKRLDPNTEQTLFSYLYVNECSLLTQGVKVLRRKGGTIRRIKVTYATSNPS